MTDDARPVCVQCIGDEFLTAEILKTGQTAVCGYCGKTDKTETISELADRFHDVFEEHYERAGEVEEHHGVEPDGGVQEDAECWRADGRDRYEQLVERVDA